MDLEHANEIALNLIDAHKAGSNRRETQLIRYRILTDSAKQWLHEQIDLQFQDPDNRASIKTHLDLSNNVYRFIIRLLSAVYASPPNRELSGDSDSSQLFRAITGPELDQSMDTICKMTMALNECFVRPIYVDGAIDLEILLPQKVEVYSDSARLRALVYLNQDDEFCYWDDSWFFRFDVTGNPLGEPVAHGYGRIPWICYRREKPAEGYWLGDSGNDLVECFKSQTIWRAYLARTGFHQSFVQLAQKTVQSDMGGLESQIQKEQTLGVGSILQGEFQTLDLRTDLQGFYAVVEKQLARTAANWGISPDVLQQSKMSSGLEKLLSHSSLKEHRQSLIKMFRPADLSLMNLICVVWNRDSNSPLQFPADIFPRINYQEPKLVTSELDELRELELGSKLGVFSPVDYLLKKDPDITTREDAQQQIEKRLAEINVVLRARQQFNQQEQQDQANGALGGRPADSAPTISSAVDKEPE